MSNYYIEYSSDDDDISIPSVQSILKETQNTCDLRYIIRQLLKIIHKNSKYTNDVAELIFDYNTNADDKFMAAMKHKNSDVDDLEIIRDWFINSDTATITKITGKTTTELAGIFYKYSKYLNKNIVDNCDIIKFIARAKATINFKYYCRYNFADTNTEIFSIDPKLRPCTTMSMFLAKSWFDDYGNLYETVSKDRTVFACIDGRQCAGISV